MIIHNAFKFDLTGINRCLNTSVYLHYINANNFIGKKVKKNIEPSFSILTMILTISIFLLPTESIAQNNLRIFEDPGGSGNGTTQTEESNDNTAMYVVGGLVIAGILVYALVIKKDKKTDIDTTASMNSNLKYSEVNGFDSAEELQKVKEKIPVDLFLGIRNNEAVMNDKTYMLGLRVKL